MTLKGMKSLLLYAWSAPKLWGDPRISPLGFPYNNLGTDKAKKGGFSSDSGPCKLQPQQAQRPERTIW